MMHAMQYSDKTLMRNALAYGLAAATGQYAPRTRFCEVLLNGRYQGVYLLVEKIKRDRHRVDVQKFQEGVAPEETGFLLKIDKNTGGELRKCSWLRFKAWEIALSTTLQTAVNAGQY
jgi:spore coat protein CotH